MLYPKHNKITYGKVWLGDVLYGEAMCGKVWFGITSYIFRTRNKQNDTKEA